MDKIPLQARLKKESWRKLASAQDLIVNETYKIFPSAVLHGGTAIWRCYNGKRFSEDLDFYLPKDGKKVNDLFNTLEKKGFNIIKKKISENSIYSELEFNRVSVRLEAIFRKVRGILCDYESSEGNIISIYSLSAENFIIEKISTYLKRFKIRDLWDIFFLLKDIKDINKISDSVSKLIKEYGKPVDEENLQSIILEGIVPSSNKIIEYIKRKWEK
jgi:predicted nucleotidyltransferase component of viral defense system